MLAEDFPDRKSGYRETLREGQFVRVIQPDAKLVKDNAIPGEWVLLSDRTFYFLPPIPDSIEPLGGEVEEITDENGATVAKVIASRWKGKLPEYTSVNARFVNDLSLDGYLTSPLEPGTPLGVTLFWKPEKRISRDVEIFVQLHDVARNTTVSGIHSWPLDGVYRVHIWEPGHIMPLSYQLRIPDDLTPGPYLLNVGVYDLLARKRIPLLAGGDVLPVKPFKVPLPTDYRVPDIISNQTFGDIITLDGYTLNTDVDGLKVILFWRAMEAPQFDYTTFVHIVDSTGQIVSQADVQPLGGQYPTSIWSANEVVVDELELSPVSRGEYKVYVGWYRHMGDGWERLPMQSGEKSPQPDRFLLGTVSIP